MFLVVTNKGTTLCTRNRILYRTIHKHTRSRNTGYPVIRRTFSQVPDKKDSATPIPTSSKQQQQATQFSKQQQQATQSSKQQQQQVTPSKKPGSVVPRRRKPTVAEEINYTKRYDIKRALIWLLLGIIVKIAYDAYNNYLQQNLYADPKAVENMWKQVGEDAWLDGKVAQVVLQRYGRKVNMTGPLTVTKNRQLRYWGTTDYLSNVRMFFFRFRSRIWEDIGTLHISAPVAGSKMTGHLHVRAFTQDNNWVLEKAWLEDEDMIIELRRRMDMDFLMNPDPEFLIEVNKRK